MKIHRDQTMKKKNEWGEKKKQKDSNDLVKQWKDDNANDAKE